MKIHLEPQVMEAKCGILARSQELGLCACGRNREEALEKLGNGVKIWSKGLAKDGILIEALKRANLRWSGDDTRGDEANDHIDVEFMTQHLQ